MKTSTLVLSLLLLAACKKEGHRFEYRAECTHCDVRYVNSDEHYAQEVIRGEMRLDSVFEGDVLLRVDTVDIPRSWSYAFDGEHDQTASIRLLHLDDARTPSTVRLFVDGTEDAARTIEHSEVTLHN